MAIIPTSYNMGTIYDEDFDYKSYVQDLIYSQMGRHSHNFPREPRSYVSIHGMSHRIPYLPQREEYAFSLNIKTNFDVVRMLHRYYSDHIIFSRGHFSSIWIKSIQVQNSMYDYDGANVHLDIGFEYETRSTRTFEQEYLSIFENNVDRKSVV